MNTKKLREFTSFILLCALTCIGSLPVKAQGKILKPQNTRQVPVKGEFSFLDGQAPTPASESISCGPASSIPRNRTQGIFNKIDVSFGILPPDERITNATATVFGSWTVRTIIPADATRSESIANYFFDGSFTHGTILDARGGGQVYDLYGTTNFVGSFCIERADTVTRRPVHIYGICGNDQEVNFEILTRLPTVVNGIPNLDERTVFASAKFRGNVPCGKTTDRTRVRTNLTRIR